VGTVKQLAERAGIGMPDVAVYDGAPNAFATGAFKNSSLVAVSTGLLESMTKEEVEAVLGHEISHVANGDMITLTLIQGVVNTFVVFFKNNDDRPGIGYMLTVFACEIVFGVLASIIVCWFSRQREFRADAGSVKLLGNNQPMIHALARLGNMEPGELPKSMAASGISDKVGIAKLFSTHPPMEERIAALKGQRT
jgi:heat shock protein HtpX